MVDRRSFLKKVAKGTVYVAPLVVTLAAPASATGQAPPSQKMSMMNMGGNNQNVGVTTRQPPWFKPPPGGG